MELNFDKLRSAIPAIIAVITTVATLFMAGKHYLDTEFVNVNDFNRVRLNMGISLLENRKQVLEHRIYVYELCKALTTKCTERNTVEADEAHDLRELEDVRIQLETLKKKLFE